MKTITQRLKIAGDYLKSNFRKFCGYQDKQSRAIGKEITDKFHNQEMYELFKKGRISTYCLDNLIDYLTPKEQTKIDLSKTSSKIEMLKFKELSNLTKESFK